MSYAGETIERALETLLKSNVAAALDAVESDWSEIEPLALPDPVNWSRGYRMWMLDLPSTYYPYVVIMVTERLPSPGPRKQADQWGLQESVYTARISVFLVADTEDDAVTLAHRYAQALVGVLQSQRYVGKARQRNWDPQVRIFADNVVHLKDGPTGDPDKAADVDYMRMVEVVQELARE